MEAKVSINQIRHGVRKIQPDTLLIAELDHIPLQIRCRAIWIGDFLQTAAPVNQNRVGARDKQIGQIRYLGKFVKLSR